MSIFYYNFNSDNNLILWIPLNKKIIVINKDLSEIECSYYLLQNESDFFNNIIKLNDNCEKIEIPKYFISTIESINECLKYLHYIDV